MFISDAIVCHMKTGEDACKHLDCINSTGCCFKGAGLKPWCVLLLFPIFASYFLWIVFSIYLVVADLRYDRLTD